MGEHMIEFYEETGIEPEDICYWDLLKQELKGSQINKAKKFNKLKLIESLGNSIFKVKPIEGYNKNTYTVRKNGVNSWKCNCQWNVKYKLPCSHILAVAFYLKNFGWANKVNGNDIDAEMKRIKSNLFKKVPQEDCLWE